jgi:hypothetical protein
MLIGDIMILAAAIDHLVTMAICAISNIPETTGLILLSKSGVTEKSNKL